MYTCGHCIWNPTCMRKKRVSPLSDTFMYECNNVEAKCEAFAEPVECYDAGIMSLCGGGYRNVAKFANHTCLIWRFSLISRNTHEWWTLIQEAVNSVPEAWRSRYSIIVKGRYVSALMNDYGAAIEDDEYYQHVQLNRMYFVHDLGENAYVIMKLPDEVTQPQGEMA